MRKALVAVAAVVAAWAWPPGAAAIQTASPSPVPLATGEVVPAFDAEGIDGAIRHVAYGKTPTVLLFFLSGCPHCHKQIPEWNRAYERRPPGVNVVGIMLDQEPPGFFMAMPISFPVVRAPNRQFSRTFKVTQVPMTVRVGAGGKVEDVGFGPQDAMRIGELFRK